MFEDATFDSRAIQSTQTPKWMLIALAINLTLLTSLIILPLIYPEGLPIRLLQQAIYAPPTQLAAQRQPQTVQRTTSVQTVPINPYIAPPLIPITIRTDPGPAPTGPTTLDLPSGPGNAPGATDTSTLFHSLPPAVVHPAQPSKIAISGGVTEGLLTYKTTPIYPPIARAAHISGTIVLAATISKSGTIEDLHVLSGPLMLRQSALDAVQHWRYQPYQLNHQPVEVETTINVVFSLTSH
jgi:protein TonB